MYYGLDENGNIIMSDSNDILPDYFQELFPDNIDDLDLYEPDYFDNNYVSSGDENLSVSAGDSLSSVSSGDSDIHYNIPNYEFITYDDLVEALALIPGYNYYPNTAAVSVFDGVFRSAGSNVNYVVLSGSNTSTTYMYYSDKATYTSGSIHLQSPVTSITYQSVTSSGTTQYRYNVSTTGDIDINLSNFLVYTNLVEGYPALPSDDRGVGSILPYNLSFILPFLLLFIPVLFFKFRKDN